MAPIQLARRDSNEKVRQNTQRRAQSAAKYFGRALARPEGVRKERSD